MFKPMAKIMFSTSFARRKTLKLLPTLYAIITGTYNTKDVSHV